MNNVKVFDTSTPRKYILGVKEGNRWWYVKSFRKGLYKWTSDHLYAKQMTIGTIYKHLRFGGVSDALAKRMCKEVATHDYDAR